MSVRHGISPRLGGSKSCAPSTIANVWAKGICAAERSIVAHIDPQLARQGLDFGQHRHGRVVDMVTLGGEHMSAWLGSVSTGSSAATKAPTQSASVEAPISTPLRAKAAVWRLSG
jgi:hypothetical protein